MRRFATGALVLAAAVGLLYAQTGEFGFLRLDDHDYTFRCPFVFDGLSWANVKAAFLSVRHAAIWMPATYVSYMADISLFGPAPGPHHLVNALLHALNAVLLFALARRCGTAAARADGGEGWWVAAATAFWALHPQRAEAVAWIAGRKDLLWAAFTLAGLLCWTARTRTIATAGAYAFCALACMSKPTAMCFPLLALCVDGLRRGGGRGATALPGADGFGGQGLAALPRGAMVYLPLVAMATATGALAVYSQTHAEGYAVRNLFSASLPWRVLNAAVAVGLDLFQTILPIGVHLDYRAVPGQFPLHGVRGLATLGVACAVLLPVLARAAAGRWCVVWFAAALLPTLGLFGSFGEHARADRFLYVPAMAVAFLPAVFAAGWLRRPRRRAALPDDGQDEARRPRRRAALPVGAGAALAAYAAAAWPVVAAYRDDFTVFSRTLRFDPDNGRALAHVASEECARRGKIDRGIDHFRRSQAVRPRDDTAAQLAYALALRGHSEDFAEIRRLCGKFACDHSTDAKGQALEALGMTALRQRRWKEAISCLEDSIRAPRRFYSAEDARLRLAAAYCNAGDAAKAIDLLERLAQSTRADIGGKARRSLDALRRNPRAFLFID